MSNCTIIFISGIVGSGKSYIGTYISKKYNIPFLKEPLTETEINNYYAGTMSAIVFQTKIIENKIKEIKQLLQNNKIILVERHFLEDKIFCREQHNIGRISNEDYKTYLGRLLVIINEVTKLAKIYKICIIPDLDLSIKQIVTRNIKEELNVSKEYWESIYKQYQNEKSMFDFIITQNEIEEIIIKITNKNLKKDDNKI
jgi:deoxyadenosine/deoxycytidine kinase